MLHPCRYKLRTSLVRSKGFVKNALQRNIFFHGKLAAIIEFGCHVQDSAVQARKFDTNVAELRVDAYRFAR